FRGVNVACFRSAWDDPGAFYLAFKGGDNKANHAHLDLGTFVLDALGYRWACDLGSDDYNLPGYFGRQRWTYYRLRTEGHNTLTINDQDQPLTAAAPIIAYQSTPQRAFAVADLSAGYARVATRVWRGVELLNRNTVVIEDEVRAEQGAAVTWNFHTPARVQIDDAGTTATLSQGDATLVAKLLSPANA